MDVKSYALGIAKMLIISLYDLRKRDRYNEEFPLQALVLHPEHWAELRRECVLENFYASPEDARAGRRRWHGILVELTLNEDAHFVTRSGRKVYL